MNEEEIIKIIKYHSCYDISEEDKKTKSWEYIDISGDEFYEFRNALIQLLNLYNQEKEKNKKLEDEAILLRKTHDYDIKMIDDVKGEAVELYRVIDRMAKQISCLSRNLDNATNFERVSEEEYDVDFIKQYYFKKARGEKDVKDN